VVVWVPGMAWQPKPLAAQPTLLWRAFFAHGRAALRQLQRSGSGSGSGSGSWLGSGSGSGSQDGTGLEHAHRARHTSARVVPMWVSHLPAPACPRDRLVDTPRWHLLSASPHLNTLLLPQTASTEATLNIIQRLHFISLSSAPARAPAALDQRRLIRHELVAFRSFWRPP
jgi:hypothetical protein